MVRILVRTCPYVRGDHVGDGGKRNLFCHDTQVDTLFVASLFVEDHFLQHNSEESELIQIFQNFG